MNHDGGEVHYDVWNENRQSYEWVFVMSNNRSVTVAGGFQTWWRLLECLFRYTLKKEY